MTAPPDDNSVFDEPHLRPGGFRPDPSEARAERILAKSRRGADPADEQVEVSVWDEPGVSPELAGPVPKDAPTYARWLEHHRAQTTAAKAALVTLGLALASGPWAIIGAFYGSGHSLAGILAIVLFGPVVEEVMKTAAAMCVVERRPYFFTWPSQIIVSVVAGAFVFAAIENLLYLNVYIPDPGPAQVWWRWTVCVALHAGCTGIAGMGVVRVWRDVWARRARPRLALAFPYLVTAIVIHGSYNAFVLAFELATRRL